MSSGSLVHRPRLSGEFSGVDRAADPAPVDITRRMWGSPDAIILLFAASSAEFAVNKAVDWLFCTNALPDAPFDRFFETVRFAQALVFEDEAAAAAALEAVNRAHAGVERLRGDRIPQWAYRDVLFMLLDCGERAYSVVYGPPNEADLVRAFEFAMWIGRGMHIEDLPATYAEYKVQRLAHLRNDTQRSEWTDRLYARYREHLGGWRMKLMLGLQASLVPPEVAQLLGLKRRRWADLLLRVYPRIRSERILRLLYPFLLPHPYGDRLAALAQTA